ncbi:MAG TPA: type II secretion system protein GspG [Fimbriiglobus sp.]|nr:type II secretion system protein GspG [Fimbriiglobus sp.]
MSPTLLLLTALIQPPATEKLDAGAISRSLVETSKAAVEVLNGVKDRATAKTAKPRLEELSARLGELEKRYAVRPRGERVKAEVKWTNERKKQAEALTLAHDRVFAKHKDAYKVLAGTGLFRRVEGALEARALLQMQNIQKAGVAYYIKNGGVYPRALKLLVVKDPNTGTPPLLAGGAKAITDPWGAPYQFDVRADQNGIERLHIWTTSPYGDGKKRIVWPQDDGKKQ